MTPPLARPADYAGDDRLDRIETAILKLTDAVAKFDERQRMFDERQRAFDERQRVFDERQQAFDERQQAFAVTLRELDLRQRELAAVQASSQKDVELRLQKQTEVILEIKGRLTGLEHVLRHVPTIWTQATLIFAIFGAAIALLRLGVPHGP